MTTLFLFCAVAGGTVLVCQFVMTLIGFGGHDLHGGEVPDIGHDAPDADGHDAHGHHGSTWLFSVISFRTLVAATAFFGLGGLGAESMQMQAVSQVAIGLICGFAAMIGVHKMMRLFVRLNEDGTVRIQRAVGLVATVYVPIPANHSGAGKIHVNLQSRLMEYPAVTANGEKLPTGTAVTVVRVVGTDTLEVAAAGRSAESNAA